MATANPPLKSVGHSRPDAILSKSGQWHLAASKGAAAYASLGMADRPGALPFLSPAKAPASSYRHGICIKSASGRVSCGADLDTTCQSATIDRSALAKCSPKISATELGLVTSSPSCRMAGAHRKGL